MASGEQAVIGKDAPQRIMMLGASVRDFHNFNVVYCDDPDYRVVAFTPTQIPGISGRRYAGSALGGEAVATR